MKFEDQVVRPISTQQRQEIVRSVIDDRDGFVILDGSASRQFETRLLRPVGLMLERIDDWSEPEPMTQLGAQSQGGAGSAGTGDTRQKSYMLSRIVPRPLDPASTQPAATQSDETVQADVELSR